jgi:hypothetical protein
VIACDATAWVGAAGPADGGPEKMGMNREGVDNAQFVLNALHWLMGMLD